MSESILTICNKRGLHARAAAKFVQTAETFEAEITVKKDGQEVLGTSIMGLMMLAASKGTTIAVSASGSDAADAIEAVKQLVEAGFHESD